MKGVIVHADKEQALAKDEAARKLWLATYTAVNIDVTRAFFSHPKILITAMNGPAVGLSAALIAHSDFIYHPHEPDNHSATEESFLLTPFVTLGLVGEGCASYTFAKRLGLSKANEALLSARKIPASELLACGFLNKILPSTPSFLSDIRKHAEDTWGGYQLNRACVLEMKKLIRMGWETEMEATNVREHFAGLEKFANGIPQGEFVSAILVTFWIFVQHSGFFRIGQAPYEIPAGLVDIGLAFIKAVKTLERNTATQ
ncbi:hypothetical protein FGG08_004406 [Glutinoglossum americanum]|uniref:Uncharacterized protein n=1 Tax=Glutinoglossum americanum TaxID=1670608 RepID=A0A9P8I5U9_9PEZI|nr:hypothetical protein FGG08_004406 [Glutinoglossum americanum]